MSLKVLIVGCGNIGAFYDLHDNEKVWTHLKAFSKRPDVEVTVFDTDPEKLQKVAEVYKVDTLTNIDNAGNFGIVSISTPTDTHFSYLDKFLRSGTPVILCEKPLVGSMKELGKLAEIYKSSDTKVLVNYIRRFQPEYAELRKSIRSRPADSFRGIVVKYRRGLLNNGSHAIDLIEYLFGSELNMSAFIETASFEDAFPSDPTISCGGTYLQMPFSFVGVPDISYPLFEIEIFHKDNKTVICHSGDEIRTYEAAGGKLEEIISVRRSGILGKYMVPVVEEAINLYHNKSAKDNFASSFSINKKILELLESIKEKNGAISD